MLIAGKTLFAFVDPKDPFMEVEIEGEKAPGPILSLMGSQQFRFLFLFFTPHTKENAVATKEAVVDRYPDCHVMAHELPVSDPKDYSSLMGSLARQVRDIVRRTPDAENSVCVSSGTAEMRAAWFLLTAAGVLPAKLLQIGSPNQPLFGSANVKEVRFDSSDWDGLRHLMMPREYFRGRPSNPISLDAVDDVQHREIEAAQSNEPILDGIREGYPVGRPARNVTHPQSADLEEALQELGIVTYSAITRQAAENAAIAADSRLPILLLGETGVGKELFAKLIHRMSERQGRSLIAVNCAGIPSELAASHLFGHVRGAFTGPVHDHRGIFESAHGSTLFLDEVGELSLDVQAMLLRVLEDGVVKPLGSTEERHVDVRVVAATNRDLAEEVASKRFREDLYYRLEVIKIQLAPLRDRREEIAQLAVMILRRENQTRLRQRQFSRSALRRLEQHDWPGNVRELSNVVVRACQYCANELIESGDLLINTQPVSDPLAGLPTPSHGFVLQDFLKQARRLLIQKALDTTRGNQSEAAALLGITKQAVSNFVNGIDNPA